MIVFENLLLEEIDQVRLLWEENSRFHHEFSTFFNDKEWVSQFYNRKKSWCEKEKTNIIVAKNKEIIGFCVSTISKNLGSIESLFVNSEYRRQGIGGKLVRSQIEWLKNNSCNRIEVSTSYGNEAAIAFYKKLGIYPKSVRMELK